jgi:hypothetical protein
MQDSNRDPAGKPEVVTQTLDDGRTVDVFLSGTVQVYEPNGGKAWEFRLPNPLVEVEGTPLTVRVHRLG